MCPSARVRISAAGTSRLIWIRATCSGSKSCTDRREHCTARKQYGWPHQVRDRRSLDRGGYAARLQAGTSGVESGDGLRLQLADQSMHPSAIPWLIACKWLHSPRPGLYRQFHARDRGHQRDSREAAGRLAALWRISEDFSLKLSALEERSKAGRRKRSHDAERGRSNRISREGSGPGDGTVRACSA